MNPIYPKGTEPLKRGVRSYVLRTGRITESQKRAFDRHWQGFGLERENGILDQQQVFGRIAPLVVEIGFGMGESLHTMAQQEGEKDFIGIEVHPPGVGRLLNNLAQTETSNVKIFRDDALAVMNECIANSSLTRLQLYFPDPWPKKKHHKRRIVQHDFVKLAWEKLQAKGIFHLATDWQPYAEHMMAVFAEWQNEFSNLAGADQFAERPEFRPSTKFEQRGRRLGHGVWDLLFEKKSG